MPETAIFALTVADLQRVCAPINGAHTFRIAAGADMEEAVALEYLRTAEDRVLGRIPNRYRQLVRRVDGEVLVRRAGGGETAAQTGLSPISRLELYRNWVAGSWDDRDRNEALVDGTDYTVAESTGAITLLQPLARGDRLWAAYDHAAGAQFRMLRDVATRLAAVAVARDWKFFDSSDGAESFERMESGAYLDLENMQGIDAIDRLDLVVHLTERDNWSAIMRLGVD